MEFNEVKGDLIQLSKKGMFDVITHGCNCMCTMGAGIAPQMAKAFGADKFELENLYYKGDYNKLGQISWKSVKVQPNYLLYVVNSYTQYNYGRNHADGDQIPLDYDALRLCLRKINHQFKGKHIGLPLIGCGLAGGLWNLDAVEEKDKHLYSDFPFVRDIIQIELGDMDVTVVHFDDKYLK